MTNHKKIINDPLYGFISIKSELIYQLIQHPYFQRLRRIKQLGLTEYVYPGALHTRFHHALGAMHLMGLTLDSLRRKGVMIFEEEYEAALVAILLHDIGHGPFSHALEHTILDGVDHETISLLLMKRINDEFQGKLSIALLMFQDKYHRKFFHQLISSQLDMDRLDYLQRDCFYTGVKEGNVGADRIIRMLDVVDDQIVVEEKAIYSIEHFLNARRLMYWQVYLHKTTVSTEHMLILLINRAKHLFRNEEKIDVSTSLKEFLIHGITLDDLERDTEGFLTAFTLLDDHDIWFNIKLWASSKDEILSLLSKSILERKLFKTVLTNEQLPESQIRETIEKVKSKSGFNEEEVRFLVASGYVSNAAYLPNNQQIIVKTKKGELLDITKASDLPHIEALGKIVKKFYLCYPKSVDL